MYGEEKWNSLFCISTSSLFPLYGKHPLLLENLQRSKCVQKHCEIEEMKSDKTRWTICAADVSFYAFLLYVSDHQSTPLY